MHVFAPTTEAPSAIPSTVSERNEDPIGAGNVYNVGFLGMAESMNSVRLVRVLTLHSQITKGLVWPSPLLAYPTPTPALSPDTVPTR